MATRNDYQVALDIIKSVNIINDFVDCASYILRDIDPSSGEPYIDRETEEPYSVTEIKQQLGQVGTNILAYHIRIKNYIDKVDVPRLVTALNIMGIDALQAKTDMDNFKSVIMTITPQVQAALTKADFLPIADYIDANTEKLELVRRSWSL